MSSVELELEIASPNSLRLETAVVGTKTIDVAYAPFDFVNSEARIAIVGMTPGRQQMANALREAHRLLLTGASIEAAAKAAKTFASFSGPMRNNLVEMLDHVGVAKMFGLATTSTLWGRDVRMVHFTSALRYPVFVAGENYSGSPDILRTPLLTAQLRKWFAAEMASLQHAIFVPLGPKVGAALLLVSHEIVVNPIRILA